MNDDWTTGAPFFSLFFTSGQRNAPPTNAHCANTNYEYCAHNNGGWHAAFVDRRLLTLAHDLTSIYSLDFCQFATPSVICNWFDKKKNYIFQRWFIHYFFYLHLLIFRLLLIRFNTFFISQLVYLFWIFNLSWIYLCIPSNRPLY